MVTIMRWTGKEARILRETALRMTVRDFAAHTNLSTYAIRDIENKGERAHLRTATQKILDETLAAASDDAKQRFAATALHTSAAGDIGRAAQPPPRHPATAAFPAFTVTKPIDSDQAEIAPGFGAAITLTASPGFGDWLPGSLPRYVSRLRTRSMMDCHTPSGWIGCSGESTSTLSR